MIRAVCFDLMDTLVADPYLEALEAGAGMAFAEFVTRRDPRAWPAFEAGETDEASFLSHLVPDGSFDGEAFTRVRRDGYRLLPGMGAVLDELDGRARRWVASNYPVWIDEVLDRCGLRGRVDGVTVSCREGVRKPEPAFFERLVAQVGVPPSQCLFVDDRVANCEAAERAGLRAHRFDGADGLCRRLHQDGLPHPDIASRRSR